jgi:hypothetical protein
VAQDFFRNSSYWKEGTYFFEVELEIVGRQSPHKECFRTFFGKADIDSFHGNFNLFESYIRTFLKSQGGQQVQWPQWKWVSPIITPTR